MTWILAEKQNNGLDFIEEFDKVEELREYFEDVCSNLRTGSLTRVRYKSFTKFIPIEVVTHKNRIEGVDTGYRVIKREIWETLRFANGLYYEYEDLPKNEVKKAEETIKEFDNAMKEEQGENVKDFSKNSKLEINIRSDFKKLLDVKNGMYVVRDSQNNDYVAMVETNRIMLADKNLEIVFCDIAYNDFGYLKELEVVKEVKGVY